MKNIFFTKEKFCLAESPFAFASTSEFSFFITYAAVAGEKNKLSSCLCMSVCVCANVGEQKKICVTQIKNLKVAQPSYGAAFRTLQRFALPAYATIYAQNSCCCSCTKIVNVLSFSLLPSLGTLIRVET